MERMSEGWLISLCHKVAKQYWSVNQHEYNRLITEIRASWKEVEELRVENENLKRNLSKPRNLIYDQYFGLCESNSELMTRLKELEEENTTLKARVSELEGELKETVIQLTEEISKTVPLTEVK